MKFTIYEWQRHLPSRFTPRSSRRQDVGHSAIRNPQSAIRRPLQPFNSSTLQRLESAFTLIELLVVIAIAVIICALLITAGGKMVQNSNIQRATSERDQLETAIDAYYHKYGYYPPGNANTGNAFVTGLTNQLYYELIGTTRTNWGSGDVFEALDGSSTISTQNVIISYGVGAFMNSTKNGNADDTIPAQTFLSGLKAGEIASNGVYNFIVTAANSDSVYIPMPGVFSLAGRPANPWRYICPGTNNPNSYDLWVQVFVGNRTNLICNWHKDPLINVQL